MSILMLLIPTRIRNHSNDRRIRIGGVSDLDEGSQNINATIADVKTDDFVILVSHNPDYVPQIKSDKVDLVLAGDTHGGQITLFGLYAPVIESRYGQKFRTGHIQLPSLQLIVSNGIGTVLLPMRFFARPQIVTVVLKSA